MIKEKSFEAKNLQISSAEKSTFRSFNLTSADDDYGVRVKKIFAEINP